MNVEPWENAVSKEALYQKAEARANRFNLKCLALLIVLSLLTETLNEIGIFTVEKAVMRCSISLAVLLFALPRVIVFIHDRKHPDDTILKKESLKYVIVLFTYLGIGILCVALASQAVLLMTMPPIIAAQYRDQKRLLRWTLVGTVLLVPIGVYGGFFLGMPDRILLKGMTEEEALVLSNRLAYATPKRMWELLFHHTIPRLICVTVIAVLASGITRSNQKMLKVQAELSEKIQREMERRNSLQTRVIESLATLIENRDQDTGDHVVRTKMYVGMIARQMRKYDRYKGILTDQVIAEIESAAPLHDVGKIAVRDMILLKPGKLTAEEFEEMKKHAEKGGQVIRNIFSNIEDDAAFLRIAEEIAVSHHEKWNGTGYPSGLKGEEIPLPARIMAVADVFDALVSVRVYKPAMTPEAALELIESESGSHFDPDIIRIVTGMRQELIDTAKTPIERN